MTPQFCSFKSRGKREIPIAYKANVLVIRKAKGPGGDTKREDIENIKESEFIIRALQQTLSGTANQGDEIRHVSRTNPGDEIRHARYVLREIKRIKLQLETANGREHSGGPGIIGRKIL